jgi:hypothetical protein
MAASWRLELLYAFYGLAWRVGRYEDFVNLSLVFIALDALLRMQMRASINQGSFMRAQ